MDLSDLLADAEGGRTEVTVYAADEPVIVDQLDAGPVDVEVKRLPPGDPPGFVVVRDRGEFVGSIGIAELEAVMTPPIRRPWSHDSVDATHRTVFGVLEDVMFGATDRRRLLAAARWIESRAWHVGTGELHAGFQRFSAFEDQVPVYERLGEETDLEIHVYGEADWQPPSIANIVLHAEDADEIGRFWFLAFDGGSVPDSECALVAEERSTDRYEGFWTADGTVVEKLLAHLRDAYG